jgi:hypothetical protein
MVAGRPELFTVSEQAILYRFCSQFFQVVNTESAPSRNTKLITTNLFGQL